MLSHRYLMHYQSFTTSVWFLACHNSTRAYICMYFEYENKIIHGRLRHRLNVCEIYPHRELIRCDEFRIIFVESLARKIGNFLENASSKKTTCIFSIRVFTFERR